MCCNLAKDFFKFLWKTSKKKTNQLLPSFQTLDIFIYIKQVTITAFKYS